MGVSRPETEGRDSLAAAGRVRKYSPTSQRSSRWRGESEPIDDIDEFLRDLGIDLDEMADD